jgi:hypothetical protein
MNAGAGAGTNVLCNSATDKALGAGFAPTLTGANASTLAIRPVDSGGNIIASGTPNGWKFSSSDSGNSAVVVYITCAP